MRSDTSPEAQRVQVELWRRMSALEKAQATGRASMSVRELALAGIRERHASASERECLLHYALITLGPQLAMRAYPEAGAILDR